MAILDKIALPLRAVQLLCAIVVLGIAGHMDEFFSAFGYTWTQGNYNVFVGAWTLLLTIYFIVAAFVFKEGGGVIGIVNLVLEALTWIFWLAAFACVASFINGFTGSSQLNAIIAFGVIEWVLFSVTLALTVMAFMRGKST